MEGGTESETGCRRDAESEERIGVKRGAKSKKGYKKKQINRHSGYHHSLSSKAHRHDIMAADLQQKHITMKPARRVSN